MSRVFKNLITNEEIRHLKLIHFDDEIHIVDTLEEQEKFAEELFKEKVLGFDTEAKPSFKKGVIYPVSLLQLSTKHKAFLFRLNHTGIGDNLKKILESKEILKIGVAINDDISDLRKLRDFKPGGFVGLEKEVKRIGIESNGLRKLAAIILNKRISKNAQVSNWEAEKLSEKQITYAATDAWITMAMLEEIQLHYPDFLNSL